MIVCADLIKAMSCVGRVLSAHSRRWSARLSLLAVAGTMALSFGTKQVMAQADPEPSTCLAIAERLQPGPRVWRASWTVQTAQAEENTVLIHYVGHSAFRLTTAQGVSAITDFYGYVGEGALPEAVTMNHAHSTHYTDNPDPAIAHVLRGWVSDGQRPARHRVRIGDLYIRNVPTDLYARGLLYEEDGNSIFVFETAGLCIGHLGHLHHTLSAEHIAQIGRLDIIFMPVDGTYTMSQAGMIDIANQLRASVVIPMHFFSEFSLQRFVDGMSERFAIQRVGGREVSFSLNTLPERPTVVVLNPY